MVTQLLADRVKQDRGQTTVEAAVALPVVFILVLLLVQPAILLYDRMVMEHAANEACRLLVTADAGGGQLGEDFVRRRLGAIPPVDCFHVHSSGCSWRITCSGDDSSEKTSVTIATEVRPLPLFDGAGALLGLVNERGNVEIEVTATRTVRPRWATVSLGGSSPADKVGVWVDG